MNFHRRTGGHDSGPRDQDPKFVDVSEEWVQLGSDWLSNLFPSLKSRSDEERAADEIPPRRLKH